MPDDLQAGTRKVESRGSAHRAESLYHRAGLLSGNAPVLQGRQGGLRDAEAADQFGQLQALRLCGERLMDTCPYFGVIG